MNSLPEELHCFSAGQAERDRMAATRQVKDSMNAERVFIRWDYNGGARC